MQKEITYADTHTHTNLCRNTHKHVQTTTHADTHTQMQTHTQTPMQTHKETNTILSVKSLASSARIQKACPSNSHADS